jgi:hypothetical protein
MVDVQHDGVTQMLATQIETGIAKINEANEVLLNQESSETGNREIDKVLKEEFENLAKNEGATPKDEKAAKAFAKAQKLREQFRSALNEARNLYRVNVLNEEEISDEPEIDKDALKEVRATVLSAIKLATDYAKSNNNQSVLKWAESISVPQVGRAGSSTVSGTKKPRAYVKFDGKVFESFGEAAKALSVHLTSEDNKVTVTSPELVQAWDDAGAGETFDFNGVTVTVTPKEKKSDKAA